MYLLQNGDIFRTKMKYTNKPSKEELQTKYDELKSATKLGEFYRISQGTALNWMTDYGIERIKSTVQISKEKKPYKEELQRRYEELGSTRRLGELYGVSHSVAMGWMKKYGIKTNKPSAQIFKENMPSKEELEAKCKEVGYNSVKVGEYYKVADATALRWMKDYDIKTNKSKLQISHEKKPSKEELQRKYEELRSPIKLGDYYDVTPSTALRWMRNYGIKSFTQSTKEKKPSKEELQRKYEGLGSTKKLGEFYKVSRGTASNWMESYRIEKNKSPRQISHEKKPSKEELEAKCKEFGYNAQKVGKFYEVDGITAWGWMKKYGIKTNKSASQISQEKKPSKEELQRKYEGLGSTKKLGEFYKVSASTAWGWMKDYDINMRRCKQNSLEEAVHEYLGEIK